MITQKQK
jgi:hypothetical protein